MTRNIRLLFLFNFLSDFRFQAPFLVIYFAQITGSYFLAMTILAVEQVTSALMDIPTGIWSDHIGRKTTLILGSVSSAASMLCYALAHHLGWLLIGGALSGLSMCLFNGNNNALLYESLRAMGQEDQFHHHQGQTRSMFQLALGVSAFCSSLLVPHGLRLLFALDVVPQVLLIGVGFFFKEPHVHIAASHSHIEHFKMACRGIVRNAQLRWLIAGQAISYGFGEGNFSMKGAFVNTLWPMWAVGIYRAINHAFGFIGYWVAGFFLDRMPAASMLIVAEAYWFLSQSVAVFIRNFFSPIIFITAPLVYGPFVVARDHLLQKEFTDAQRAAMGSVASFLGSLVYAVAGLGIGLISDRFGLAVGIGCGVVGSACSLPFYLVLFRRYFRSGS